MAVLPLSDCEPLTSGVQLQPVNTLTSLAYVAAAAWLVTGTRARRGGWLHHAHAAAMVAAGLGSALYHGVGGRWSAVAHDTGVALVAATTAGLVVVALRRSRWRALAVAGRSGRYAVGALGLAVPFQLFGRTGGLLCQQGAIPAHGVWHVLTAVALAAVGVAAARGVDGVRETVPTREVR